MLTEKDFCDYDTCVALKELGITACGLRFYEKGCPNTLYQNHLQPLTIRTAEALDRVLAISLYYVQKWLREEKKLFVNVELFGDYDRDADGKTLGTWVYYSYGILNTTTANFIREYDLCTEYQTYEEALLEGIKETVKILKDGIGE